MTPFVKNIKDRTPFKMWIRHENGSIPESTTLPISIRGKTNIPNMKWALNFISNYRTANIDQVIFYENGVEFGTYKNGVYQGKYKIY